ncbi:MAG: hypothetical protein V1872_02945 [bacterium]
MKKNSCLIMLLSFLMLISITACGGGGDVSNNSIGNSPSESDQSADKAMVVVSLGSTNAPYSTNETGGFSTLDSSVPADVSSVRLTQPVVQNIPLDGTEVVLELNAQTGVRFEAIAYNSYNDKLYSAQQIVDLLAGETTTIDFTLQPLNLRQYIQNSGNYLSFSESSLYGFKSPHVFYNGSTYTIFYSYYDNVETKWCLGRSTSTDKITWTGHTKVLAPDESTDFTKIEAGQIHKIEETSTPVYKMWYTTAEEENGDTVLSYVDWSGLSTWPSVTDTPTTSRTHLNITGANPCVFYNASATPKYKMWYDDGANIYYTTSSDGTTWSSSSLTSFTGTSRLALANWDSNGTIQPNVGWDNQYSCWKMLYIGRDENSKTHVGFATSTDGINWQRASINPLLDVVSTSSPTIWQEDGIDSICTLNDSTYDANDLVWFTGRQGSNYQIGFINPR